MLITAGAFINVVCSMILTVLIRDAPWQHVSLVRAYYRRVLTPTGLW
jgi:hypothetical protein